MRRFHGFSLMEMMVVLAIVAIVAAASAPMINKKMVRETSDTSIWTRTTGKSIGYNLSNDGQNTTTVGIGSSLSRPNNIHPKLYLASSTDNTPHIIFGYKDSNFYRLTAGGEKNNIWLSNKTKPESTENAVVIGPNATASAKNAIAIGNNAQATAENSAAIGYNAKSEAANQIVIGDANSVVYIPGTLRVNGFAIDNNAYVNGSLYVGQRGYFGLKMHPRRYKFNSTYKGDTSIIFGGTPRDDNEEEHWVKDGGSGTDHSIWDYYALTKSENENGKAVCLVTQKLDKTNSFGNNFYNANGTSSSLTDIVNTAIQDINSKFNKDSSSTSGHRGRLSDKRLKNVGKNFTCGLDKIRQLEIFNFTFKDDKTKTPQVGVMAQDLQKIFPDAVKKGEDGFLRIRMEDMFYALVNAVKENDTRITELEKENKELLKRIEALEKANK